GAGVNHVVRVNLVGDAVVVAPGDAGAQQSVDRAGRVVRQGLGGREGRVGAAEEVELGVEVAEVALEDHGERHGVAVAVHRAEGVVDVAHGGDVPVHADGG